MKFRRVRHADVRAGADVPFCVIACASPVFQCSSFMNAVTCSDVFKFPQWTVDQCAVCGQLHLDLLHVSLFDSADFSLRTVD